MPVKEVVSQLISLHQKHLISALQYLHPFHEGGLLLVFSDEASLVEALSAETNIDILNDSSLHRLRYSELTTLCLPQVFYGADILNERPHLLHWVRNRGQILYGEDIRAELPEPTVDQVKQMLVSHLKSCMLFVRGHLILDDLIKNDYDILLQRLNFQVLQLIAISLLLSFNLWDISLTNVTEVFLKRWPSAKTTADCMAFSELVNSPTDRHSQATAMEVTWLFNAFLRNLKDDVV